MLESGLLGFVLCASGSAAQQGAPPSTASTSPMPASDSLATSRKLVQEGKFDEAIAALNPADAATYYKLADAYSRIQKCDDAERLLQRSIWLDATSTGPYVLRGKLLEKKGEYELAVRALQRAAMDPNNPTPHHLPGQAYRDMGKKEDAENELKLTEQLAIRQDSRP